MKIGFVRRGYSPTGGAEAYLKRLAGSLVATGHEVTLFGTDAWPRNEWPGELVALPGTSPRIFADSLRIARNSDACEKLFSLERVWECDVLRAGDGVHRAWLELRAQHESKWRNFWSRRRRKNRELLRLEASLFGEKAARAVIANSNLVKNQIIAEYGYPADAITVIYNGAPESPSLGRIEELRVQTRRELNVSADAPLILFVGSGWRRKGLAQAAKAVSSIRGATFIVAGRGKRAEAAGGSHIRHLEKANDLEALYCAADAFILPTLYDPFSNASLEALKLGLPVVTTRWNGVAEIMRPDDGTVVQSADDVEGLASGLQKVLEQNGELRKTRIEHFSSYSVERNTEATLSLLKRDEV